MLPQNPSELIVLALTVAKALKVNGLRMFALSRWREDILRQALGLRSTNLLGYSFGGVVAQAYATEVLENLSHLISKIR